MSTYNESLNNSTASFKTRNEMSWVYILTNPCFRDNLLKIGYSSKDPQFERSDKLSQSKCSLTDTGLPNPFELKYSIMVKGGFILEQAVHDELKNARHANDKEFFNITLYEAVTLIREIAGDRRLHEVDNSGTDAVKTRSEEDRLKAAINFIISKKSFNSSLNRMDTYHDIRVDLLWTIKQLGINAANDKVEAYSGILRTPETTFF